MSFVKHKVCKGFAGGKVAAPMGASYSDDELCARYWAKKPSLGKGRWIAKQDG